MRRLAIAALVVGLAACSSNDNNSVEPVNTLAITNAAVVGEYTLRTIDGKPLPYTFPDGSVLTGIASSVTADGKVRSVIQYADGFVGVDLGTYTFDPATGACVITGANGAIVFGTYKDGVSTLNVGGQTWVYAKF